MAYVYSNGEGAYIGYVEDTKPAGKSEDILIEINKTKDIRNIYKHDGSQWILKITSDNKGSISDDVRAIEDYKNEDLTDIRAQLAGIPNQTYITEKAKIVDVNNALALRDTQIASLASGSPKGVYANVSTLQTAFPTGNNNIYIVINPIADGKDYWYYWNGSAWTSGGVYQSTGLTQKSVDETIVNDAINNKLKATIFTNPNVEYLQGAALVSGGTSPTGKMYANNMPSVYEGYIGTINLIVSTAGTLKFKVLSPISGTNYKVESETDSITVSVGNLALKNNIDFSNLYIKVGWLLAVEVDTAQIAIYVATTNSNIYTNGPFVGTVALTGTMGNYLSYNYTVVGGAWKNNVDNTVNNVVPTFVANVNKVNNTINDTIETHENLLVSVGRILNTLYDTNTHNPTASAICDCFQPITLQPGVTYYVKNVWGYFSPIKDANGNWTLLDSSTNRPTNKSFTVSTVSTLYLTIHHDYVSNCVLTTDVDMYNQGLYDTYYTFSNKIKENISYKCTVEKDGSGNFTSLYEAIQYAEQFMDSKVYVGDGIWDIIAELGDDYINSVSAATTQRGIILKNRIHVIFSSKANIVCNYTGTRTLTRQWLSVFNAGQYGFTIENLNVQGSNIRYIIHDERDSDPDAYVNKYCNCNMKLDNSNNPDCGATNCIGGGLGLDGYVEFDGCVFDSEPTAVYPSHIPLLTYHNSAGANAKSHVSIKNCYLKKDGLVRLNWYGQSTDITECEVIGCSMGSAILSQAETSDGTSPYVNMAVTEWNNTVRA